MNRLLFRWWPLLAIAAFLVGGACLIYRPSSSSSGADVAAALPRPQVSASSDVLDFGSTALNMPVVRQLLLRNDGAEPVVAVLSVESTSAGAAFATDVARVTLMPAVSSKIPVRLDATRLGEFVDRLKISFANGTDPLSIELRGRTFDESVASAARPLEQARPLGEPGPGLAEGGQSPLDATGRARTMAGAASSAGRGGAEGGVSRQRRSAEYADARAGTAQGARATQIYPFNPATSAPVVGLADASTKVASDRISSAERASAHPLHEGVPDVPEEASGSDDSGAPDAPEDDRADSGEDKPKPEAEEEEEEELDPNATPTFTVSSLSAVTLLGTSVRFSPQGVRLQGAAQGGAIGVQEPFQFPIVPLAFGESMLISQAGAGSGVFDPASGTFRLQLPLLVVDSDGDAAPLVVELTTGISYGKNDAGIVVSLSGSPRVPTSGWLKLVGLQKIPVGYRNGAEDSLMGFEILGQLSFNSGAPAAL